MSLHTSLQKRASTPEQVNKHTPQGNTNTLHALQSELKLPLLDSSWLPPAPGLSVSIITTTRLCLPLPCGHSCCDGEPLRSPHNRLLFSLPLSPHALDYRTHVCPILESEMECRRLVVLAWQILRLLLNRIDFKL